MLSELSLPSLRQRPRGKRVEEPSLQSAVSLQLQPDRRWEYKIQIVGRAT